MHRRLSDPSTASLESATAYAGRSSESTSTRTVALLGNPNTGKSTIFNALTGYRQRVGNYPGVTVEKRTGLLRGFEKDTRVELIDLPGAYSLSAGSEDEAIVMDVLLGRQEHTAHPDLLLVVADASNLTRNLFFTTQLMEIGRPVVIALNMVDVAEKAGIHVDAGRLSDELGVPVVKVVATREIGIDELKIAIVESLDAAPPSFAARFPSGVAAEIDGLLETLRRTASERNGNVSRVEALQLLLDPGGYHERDYVRRFGQFLADDLAARRARIAAAGESLVELEASVRYGWIDGIVQRVVARSKTHTRPWTDRVDRVLTHRVFGGIILIVLLAGVFQAIYSWAAPVMDVIESAFSTAGVLASRFLPEGALQSLIANGIIAGVGAVVVFLPQIMILFLFIAVLEDCGYMARAAFLLDRWMGLFGLNGKSLIPLVSSFACAVPAILATRTIENRRDRFVTILIAPLMSCSARLPVYVLLIAAFIPATPLPGGLIGLQAVTLLALYCVGALVAIPVALLLKRTVLPGETQSFLMELPTYKLPSVRTVAYRVYEQGREFCITAGTIIFAVTIVVWALGYYPRSSELAVTFAQKHDAALRAYEERLDKAAAKVAGVPDGKALTEQAPVLAVMQRIEQLEDEFAKRAEEAEWAPDSDEWAAARAAVDEKISALVMKAGAVGSAALEVYAARQELTEQRDELAHQEGGAHLGYSILGRMGRWIEPAVMPLGWDWRIGTAAIAAFPAREVFIATMATIYNLGAEEDEESTGLRERLREATWPDGTPVYSIPVALSIMVFFALCCQCGGTLAAIKRETRRWRWPLLTFTYMTVLAYVGALLTYQVAVRLV